MADTPAFQTWAIVEIMGHRRLAGWLTEQQIAGTGFLRLDVPALDPEAGFDATQLYNPSSIYAITPCTEDTARRAATIGRVAPVQQWELPAPKPRDHVDSVDDGPYDYGDDDQDGGPL
jgi:hypothetical protein